MEVPEVVLHLLQVLAVVVLQVLKTVFIKSIGSMRDSLERQVNDIENCHDKMLAAVQAERHEKGRYSTQQAG